MNQPKTPIWRKSMLAHLGYDQIREQLYELSENGDMYGFDREEQGYYQEYKELFDEMADGAYRLGEALNDYDTQEHWDDMTVATLGPTQRVLGFDVIEQDYYGMMSHVEQFAVEDAEKRVERLTKKDMLRLYGRVLTTLVCFLDLKAAHDCLTSIIQELDEKGVLLERKNTEINRIYEDLTGENGKAFDQIIAGLPQRMWLE